MNHRKCKVCRHHASDFCRRLSKPCAEVQDDAQFDPCGVSISDPLWDLRTHKDKATKKKLQEQEVLDSINEIE